MQDHCMHVWIYVYVSVCVHEILCEYIHCVCILHTCMHACTCICIMHTCTCGLNVCALVSRYADVYMQIRIYANSTSHPYRHCPSPPQRFSIHTHTTARAHTHNHTPAHMRVRVRAHRLCMEKLAPNLAAHSGVDVVEVAYATAVRSG